MPRANAAAITKEQLHLEDQKYALLIHSDNISHKYISCILDEMSKYGVTTYKRIYGDWTSPQAGRWR